MSAVQILEQSSLAVLLVADDRTIVDANEPASELLGLEPGQLNVKRIEEFCTPEHRSWLEGTFQALLETGVQAGETTFVHRNGTSIPCAFSASANIVPGFHLWIMIPPETPWPETGTRGLRESEASTLTTREREVLGLLAVGETNQTIAKKLNLSPETVRNHTRTARLRLGARSRSHAITLALSSGQLELKQPADISP